MESVRIDDHIDPIKDRLLNILLGVLLMPGFTRRSAPLQNDGRVTYSYDYGVASGIPHIFTSCSRQQMTPFILALQYATPLGA
jgi:hypothetical protein